MERWEKGNGKIGERQGESSARRLGTDKSPQGTLAVLFVILSSQAVLIYGLIMNGCICIALALVLA